MLKRGVAEDDNENTAHMGNKQSAMDGAEGCGKDTEIKKSFVNSLYLFVFINLVSY